MKDRRYEQGGVVSFVIVATILALLLAGAIWWAKNQGQKVASNVKQTTTELAKNVADGAGSATNNTTSNSNTSTSNTGSSSSSSSSNQTTTPQTAQTPTTPATSDNTTNSSTSANKVAPTGPTIEQIPSTGPVEIIAAIIGVSSVSAAGYLMIQSQKRIRVSALK